jgi:hypothetical protein
MYSKIILITLFAGIISACGSKETTQIAENTFVHNEKVFKIVGNEVSQIGDLSTEIEITKPTKKNLGNSSLSFIKAGAATKLEGLYRGNILYFKLNIIGLNDLREYNGGVFTVNFKDEFDFILQQTIIPSNELTSILDGNNQISYYEYNGKTEMSTEINKAIKTYDISSSVRINK